MSANFTDEADSIVNLYKFVTRHNSMQHFDGEIKHEIFNS